MGRGYGWPTDAEITAFVEDYAGSIERWVAHVMASVTDMEDPLHLSGYEIIQRVSDLCPQSDGHARAADCLVRHYDPLRAPWGFDYYPTHVACLARVRGLNDQARDTLHAWWVQSPCVDYHLPEPPADCEPELVAELATFTYAEKRYRRVKQIGQIVLLREDAPGYGETRPGILLIEGSSSRLMCVWRASYGGEWEAATECARALSRLTNWRAFDAFTPGQRRGAGIRLGEILDTQRARYLVAPAS